MCWRPVALLAGGSWCLGCSLLVNLDDLKPADGGSDSGSDSAVDSGADSAVDAAADGNSNLVTDPGFDQGMGGCGANWGNGYGDTFMRVSPGHTGNDACEVCALGSQSSFQIDAIDPIPVQAGSYYAEAWLTTPDGGMPAPAGIQVYFNGDGGSLSNCLGSAGYCQGNFFSPPTGSWASSSTTFTVVGSGTVSIDLHSYTPPDGACFIASDVALYAQ
jgi:hypothetical protein